MFKKLLDYFFPKKHSVADIVSSFQSTIDKLDAAANHHNAKSAEHFDLASEHNNKGVDALREAKNADKIKLKVQALIS